MRHIVATYCCNGIAIKLLECDEYHRVPLAIERDVFVKPERLSCSCTLTPQCDMTASKCIRKKQ